MPIIRDERFKEEVVEAYLEGTLIRDIITEYEVSSSSIYKWLGEFGFQRTQHRNRIYTFDESYFEEIDREDKAYWLGTLMAQGALINFRNTIKITASYKEKAWLKKFLFDIGSTDNCHKITGSKTYYSAIRSKKTFDDLQKLGVSCSRPDAFTLPTGLILSKELETAYVQGWEDAGGR